MDDLEGPEVPPFQEASQMVDKSFCINMVLSENGVTLLNGHKNMGNETQNLWDMMISMISMINDGSITDIWLVWRMWMLFHPAFTYFCFSGGG